MKKVDREALARALAAAREEDDASRERIESLLRERSWEEVAQLAVYGQQCRALELLPWETPPCWLRTDDDVRAALTEPHDHTGRDMAAQLVKRLLAAGLSRYEPNPIEALERAERESAQSPPA